MWRDPCTRFNIGADLHERGAVPEPDVGPAGPARASVPGALPGPPAFPSQCQVGMARIPAPEARIRAVVAA